MATKKEKTVLVVEDEIPLQNAIRSKLEKSNYLVVTARSVEQAIKHLRDVKDIDIVWLDHYLLGKENGLDFLTKVKNDNKLKNIPIFVVSNTASSEKVNSYLQLGIEKYYTKSDFRLDQIIGAMNQSLKK